MVNHEVEDLMVTTFLGYKYRKQHDLLYSQDGRVPLSLIKLYYSGQVKRLDSNSVNRGFIERYVENESVVEEVHDKDEVKGLGVMYRYMHEMDENEDLSIFSLCTFHKKLFSIKDEKIKSECDMVNYLGKNACTNCSSRNECGIGGKFRNAPALLSGYPVDLADSHDIFIELCNYEELFDNLKTLAIKMRETNDYSNINYFIRQCVILKCHLIKIHPFVDGNGRSVRCLINKLFEIAGIPPVYIAINEKDEYKRAMNEALKYRSAGEDNSDKKYNDIVGFYLYKICDSIIELDINKRIREERDEKIYDVKRKKKK